MATTVTVDNPLIGTAPPSPAGPLDAPDPTLRTVPQLPLGAGLQTLRFVMRPLDFNLWARRQAGETFQLKLLDDDVPFVITSHPDHVKSLFMAKPADAPSLTGESPLRPILGPDTVLTAIGPRHMRQRKLLLPSFHGEAIDRYISIIEDIVAREIDGWRAGETFAMAPRMQAVTLDVIMAGIFGFEPGGAKPGSGEAKLRAALRRVMGLSTKVWWPLVEAPSQGHDEPRGLLARIIAPVYRGLEQVVAERRAVPEDQRGADVLSLLLAATDEEGTPLTDLEVRNELLTLVLAGHETSANSLAWIAERLVRFPAAYDRLREEVRGGGTDDGDAFVEATIHEGMRLRPVIPMVGRIVQKPWQLGDFGVPAGTPVALNIVLLHLRGDLYPDPFAFRPERFLGVNPGTYTWIPFGGGIRRCLGASLAMTEQRIVLREIARRTDLRAADPKPERPRLRNVTLIPERGGTVVVTRRS